MGPLLRIADRTQSRGFMTSGGLVLGVAASQGFESPPLPDDISHHAQAAFRRMDEVLGAAELDRTHVCFVNVYLNDIERDVGGFNAVWRDAFRGLAPARCCIGAKLQGTLLVEMTFCAAHPREYQHNTPM